MWAIIGGTGFEKFEGFKTIEELDRNTPFGQTSHGFKRVSLEGEDVLFIPRHGTAHDKLPTEVNFRANIFALKKLGATKLLGFSAVGSLAQECEPGSLVIPEQFIDRTKGIRKVSFCGDGIVGHTSLAEPVSASLVSALKELCGEFSFKTHFGKTLVVMEGPNFSTKAESNLYRSWGGDIIGMTSYPEFALAREAGLAYMNCCFVTDYDCWKDDVPHVTVEEVMRVMKENNKRAFFVAKAMVHCKKESVVKACEKAAGLGSALMTPMDSMTSEQQEWLKVLLK
ncbi:MAG: MTAP family purine nucleoside phosphorylase [Bdellovibrionales bacterium]|nr:MTAP family purine nucleoside phosphorylase [Bdellovibrionales bacterium]